MKKRLAMVFAVGLLITSVLFAGGSVESSTGSVAGSGQAKSVKIRVGTMPNHIGVPIQYAKDNGLYEKAGLDVDVILFPTGAPINEALSAEQIDLAGSGMASVFALASGDCYWLGDTVKTVDGLGVYVRPDSPVLKEKGNVPGRPNIYGSKETVKGLTVLGALGTSDQFETVCWAQCFGLTGNDVQMLNMDRGPAVQAFKTGQGDAIACGGPPYNYELEAAGFIEAGDLTDVSGITISDGLLGRKKFIDKYPDEVQKFIEVTYQVIDQLYASDAMLADYGIKFYNANGKDYSKSMMDGEIKDKDYIGKETISKPEYRFGSTMVGMGGFYVSDGKIEKELEPNIAASLRPDFLERIYGIKIQNFE
jgi:ABC-type nitrate/sulfonate/bicarbonate transport systems, periplasmic components